MSSKTFCIYPFYGFNTNADGSVKLCCNIRTNKHVKRPDGTDYNLGHDDVDAIWNSNHMRDVRNRMLSGEEVDECSDCYRHERELGSSSRTESNNIWGRDGAVTRRVQRWKYNGTIHPPASLELRLGNTCNLQCNTCWGYSSSKTNEERIQFLKLPDLSERLQREWGVELTIPKDMNRWFKTDTYRENLKKSASELRRVYMTGGEPTLIKENCTLLEYLVECGNTDCHVSFTTNGTTADTKILSLLEHFQHCEIQVSCDGVGDRAHYVRYPTVWDDYVDNVAKIAAIQRVRLVYYTVVSAYNLYDICNILQYVDSVGNQREVTWVPIFLDYPDYMRTNVWPLTMRQNALQQLETTLQGCGNIQRWINQPGLWEQTVEKLRNHYLSTIEEDQRIERLNTFKECNSVLDRNRNTKFTTTFTEFKEL